MTGLRKPPFLKCRVPSRCLFAAILGGGLVFAVPGAAWSQSCPLNAIEVDRRQEGSKLIIRCACNTGFITSNRSCKTIDDAASEFHLTQEEVLSTIARVIESDNLLDLAADDRLTLKDRLVAFAAFFSGMNGQPAVMQAIIEMAGTDMGRNLALVAARKAAAAEATRLAAQTWMLLRPEVRGPLVDLASDYMPMKARAAYLLGVLSYRNGQYDGALNYFKDAQSVLPGDRGIDESLLIVRLAQRSQWESHHPKAARLQEARAFRAAGAQASWQMALQLLSKGDYAGSEVFMREAGVRMRRVNAQKFEIELIDDLSQKLKADREAGRRPEPRGLGMMDGWSKVDLMLTACEYGQKDWARTLHFLEIAMAADPANSTVRQAYAELKDIAASVQ